MSASLAYQCAPLNGKYITPSSNTELFQSNISGTWVVTIPMIRIFGKLFVNEENWHLFLPVAIKKRSFDCI